MEMTAPGVCPLDGGSLFDPHPTDASYLVCRQCCETLTAAELVPQASAASARNYVLSNGLSGSEDYRHYL